MAKKASCVGINKFVNYPQFALNGCVNDTKDMAALCKSLLGFSAAEVTLLTDAQATKAAILAKLGAAVADTSGDEPDGLHAPRARYVAPPASEFQGATRPRKVGGFTPTPGKRAGHVLEWARESHRRAGMMP